MAARSLLEEEINKTNRKKVKSVSEMPQQKKSTSSRRTAKSNGRSSTNVSKPKSATAVKTAGVTSNLVNTEKNINTTNRTTTSNTSSAINQPTSPLIKGGSLTINSPYFNDTKESEGLTGVKKDQMNYIVNKGKEAMQEREDAFNEWYTDDKQSLLFNDDGTLKDIQSELDLLNQNYKQNMTSLNSQQINDYFAKKRELEDALPQIQYLQDKYISENLTDKEDIKEFYTLQDAYNDTFGERALKTTGRVVGSILNMPFQAFDIAKQFLYEQQGYADFVDQNRDFYRNAGMSDEEIDEKAEGFRFNATDDNNWSQKLQKDLDDLGNQIYYGTNGAEQFALQTLEGVQNFGAHYLMAMATGGSSLATMGLQSGLDKTYQNLEEGYDINTSLGNGVLTGTLTVLTEKLPLDNFEKLVSSNLGQFSLAALASQAISEGTEEGIEYMAEPLIDKLTIGKEIDYDPGELFMSVALGMSSGAVLGGIGNMVPVINTRRQANQLQADMNTLEQYKNIGNLTTEEEIILNRTLNIAQQALNNFNSKSVIGDAVKFQSDQVQQMSAREVSENFYKFLQPQVDTETRLAGEQQAVRSVLQNAQSMLQQKGINMDVTQYASLDDNVKQQVDKIQSFANDLGINTVFDTNMDSAGMYYDGTVYINPESEIAPLTTFVHELTHGTESSRYYAPLQELIFSMQNDEDIQYGLDLIKERYNENGIDLDDDGAIREYVAIQTQDLLGNEDFVKRLVRYNTSLASRIYEGIKNIVSKTDTMQDIEYNFLKAFRDNANISSDQQYSLGNSFSLRDAISRLSSRALDENGKLRSIKDQLSDYFKGLFDIHDRVVMNENSKGLGKYGIDENQILSMNQSVVDKLFSDPIDGGHNNSVDIDIIEEVINHPEDIAFAVRNNWGNYAFVYDIKGKDGNYMLMSIKPNADSGAGFEVNNITSMYGKNDLQNYIDTVYENGYEILLNEKSDDFAAGARVQFPSSDQKGITFINSISNSGENVKHSIGLEADDLNQRLSGDDLLNVLDTIEELDSVGAEIDDKGYVTLYHRTDPESAERIKDTKKMTAKEDGIFFSTSENGTNNSGYGDSIIKVKMPVEMLEVNDIFDDEASIRVPLNNRNSVLDISKYLVSDDDPSIDNLKQKQLDIILESNPALNDFSTWIRDINDIKTFEETLQDEDWLEGDFDPDYTRQMAEDALESGRIRVYSSHPIENGIFVTPSEMEAMSYSEDGNVYSKDVALTDVAWVDPTQGQYAKVNQGQHSVGLTPEDLKATRKYERQKRIIINDLVNEAGLNNNLVDEDYGLLFNKAISDIQKTGDISEETLNELNDETWKRAVDIQRYSEPYDVQEFRQYIRNNPISMKSLGFTDERFTNPKRGVSDFASKEDWNDFRRQYFGKIKFRAEGGRSIDSIYNELKELYPGSVSNDADTPYEQLMEISRVLDDYYDGSVRVHLSEMGLLSREAFDAAFENEMEKLKEDVITGEYFHNFNTTPEAVEEDVFFTDDEIQRMLNGKIVNSDPTARKLEKVQEKLTDEMENWLPNYDILRKKYSEFSKGIFNQTLFETLVYGEATEKTMADLKKDLMQYFADENVFEGMPVAKSRIDSLINDALEYFSTDAKYKTNKKYMDSIATKVNKLLKGYNALYEGDIESTYEQVEAQQKADALLEAKRQARKTANKDAIDSILAKGKDKISRFKTLEQNLDVVADGDAELRNDLRETLEYRKFNAQNNYVNTLNKYNSLLKEFVNLGIRKGSNESKALQWLREGHREDGSVYDVGKLAAEFDYTAKNGKKMYENIQEAEKKLGEAYDEIFETINSQREDIYGDIDLHNELETQELRSKALQAKDHVENVKQQLEKNPSAELQAVLSRAEADYRRLSRAYNMRVNENADHDSTRRQKLQYRENYAHHVVNNGFFKSLKDRISGIREVPTKLAGISDYAEPKSGFANFFKKRNEGNYEADAIAGFEEYIQDAARVIAYDPYIDYLRDFADDMRVSAEGDNMSQFVRYITDYTNDLAGKTVDVDRAIRNYFGDRGFAIIKALNDRVKANSIVGNVRTAIVQLSNLPNGIGILVDNGGAGASQDILKGASNYVGSILSGGKEDKSSLSPFIQSRFFDAETGETGFKATLENMTDFMLTKGDEVGTKMIWNAAYQQALRKGEEYPIFYADDLTRRAVAGRGTGEMPLAFRSQFMNLLIPFQLETNNAFKTMTGMAKNPKSWVALLSVLITDWLFNNFTEELFGDRVLYDPIDVVSNAIEEYSSDEEQSETEFLKNLGARLGGETLGAMPFGSYIPTLLGMSEDETEELFGDSDPTRYGLGNMGLSSVFSIGKDALEGNYLDAASDLAANFLLPGGGKQIQRTIEALQVNGMLPQYVNGDLVQEPVYYTGSGNIGFVNDPESIADSPENMFDFVKQVLFGKWAGENAQNYINSGFDSLSGKKEKNLFDTLSETMSTFDAFNEAKNNSDAYENIQDSSGDSEDSSVDSSIISEFDAKQDELTGKNNAKSQFIDYITDSDYSDKQKNDIYDTYYGESKLTEFVNDFADQQDVDDETRYALKTITANTYGITDENGDSVRNSKALKVRKQLDELGLYDDYLNYISENDLDLSYMGLSKTVAKMSNAEFESEYNQMYGENYTAKSDEELLNEAYASIFGGSGTGGSSNKKSSAEDDYESYVTMKNEIDTILAKAYGGTSSVNDAYDKINNIISKIYSTNSKNSSSIKSTYSDLIEEYLEDHPTDAYLFS